MLQVKISLFGGICFIFSHCCFMDKTQVLMTVSDFLGIFSMNHFWKGAFLFNEKAPFKVGRRDERGQKK